MRKSIVAGILLSAMLTNTAVFAEDYWTEANDNIQTGIGGSEAEEKIEYAESIEEYINNGWSAEYAPVKGSASEYTSPYEDEIDLVVHLGFMQSGETGFRHREKLTYSEYVEAVKALIKYRSSNADKLTGVQNIVTCDAVIKDMVTIIGHDKVNPQKGYMIIAENCGILEGISLNQASAITREQFAKVLANTITVDMVEAIYGDNISYEIKEGNTLMAKMNITELKGWVNANENVNMYSITRPMKGKVQIDNEIYNVGTSGAENFVGRYVKAYIHEEDDEKTIIKLDVYESKDNYLSIQADDVEEIDCEKISYFPLDGEGKQLSRSKSESFDKNANVIYNGRYAGTAAIVDEKLLRPVSGRVAMADTDFDGEYDVIFVWNYEVYIIEQASADRLLLKNNKGILELSGDKEIIVNLEGETVTVDDLGAGNVISIAKTLDEAIYTIEASVKTVQGEYKLLSNDEIILEDGTAYRVDASFSDRIELGKEYTFYLTFEGKIAGAAEYTGKSTETNTGRNYGYIRKCYVSNTEEELINFRIYKLSDNSWVTLKGAEKINFYSGNVEGENTDEDKVKKEKLTPTEVAQRLNKPQLIVFSTNVYGELSSVTVATDVSKTKDFDNDLFTLSDNDYNAKGIVARTYYGGYFDGKYQQGKFIVLRVPDKPEEEKYYGTEKLVTDGNVNGPFQLYDVSEELSLDGVIIRYVETGVAPISDGGDVRITIKDIERTLLDDEPALKLTALDGKEYYISDNDEKMGFESVVDAEKWNVVYARELKVGDMLCVNLDDFGKITAFRVDVRLSEIDDTVKPFNKITGTVTPAVMAYNYGVVKKVSQKANNIVINASEDVSDSRNNMPVVASGLVYTYDTMKGKFEKLESKSDVLPGDKVVTKALYYYRDTEIIVIK